MSHARNVQCFIDCVSDLLATPEVRSMQRWRHHGSTTCYEHSMFVAYVAFRLARRWKLDYAAAARAALLHDLYLYDPADATAHPGNQCLDHPVFALRNARALCELSPKEENAIISHMWPLSARMPRYKESFVVIAADRMCCIAELMGVYRKLRRRAVVPA